MNKPGPYTTDEQFRAHVQSVFEKDASQCGIFAARCALRDQSFNKDYYGLPDFKDLRRRDWLAMTRSALYSWLWDNRSFPKQAARYSYSAAVEAAKSSHKTFAIASAAINAVSSDNDENAIAIVSSLAGKTVSESFIAFEGMVEDIKAIQAGERLRFKPLSQDVDSSNFSALSEIGFGYYATILQQISQGGAAAQGIFKKAYSIYHDTEAFFKMLEEDGDATIEGMQVYPYSVSKVSHQSDARYAELDNDDEANMSGGISAGASVEVTELISENTMVAPGTKIFADTVASQDFLNRTPLMNALKSWLLDKGNSENINLGLFGEWGAGKSTFLSLLKSSMEGQTQDVLPIWGEFNAWRYEHSENIQAGLAQEAVKALTQGLPLWQRIKLTFSFGWRTSRWKLLWLGFLVLLNFLVAVGFFLLKGDEFSDKELILFGLPVQAAILYFLFQYLQKVLSHPLADKLKTYLRLPEYGPHLGTVPVMQEQVSLLTRLRLKRPAPSVTEQYKKHRQWVGKANLTNKQNRFFFVVDDLDRCSPECVVQTLEAVRLVMDQPNVVVIIAIDQRIALASLAKHYNEICQHHRMDAESIARDYLAKIIHIPIVLDRSSDSEIEGYLQDHLWKSGRDLDDDAYTGTEQVTSDNVKGLSEVDILGSPSATKDTHSNSSVLPNGAQLDSALTEESEVADDPEVSQVEETEEAKVDADDEVTLQASDEVATGTSQIAQVEENTRTVTGLCKHQKITFLHWVKRFSFSNPRQLKRLDNSYGLMRLRYEDEDQDKTAGRLVMLLWLEYLQLQPTGLRRHFIKLIKEASKSTSLNEDQPVAGGAGSADEDSSAGDSATGHEWPLAAEHWSAIKDYLSDADLDRLYFETRGFVLPAIEETEI